MIASLALAVLSATDLTGATAAVDTRGRGAWLLDPTEDAVLLVTPGAGVERFDGCRWPSQVVVDSRGAAYVTCRQSGEVRRWAPGAPVAVWPIAGEPSALALDEAAGRLYVGLATEGAVLMLDASDGTELMRATTAAEPSAVALFPAGLAVGSRKSDVVQVFSRSLYGAPARRKMYVAQLDPSIAVSAGVEAFAPEGKRLIVVAPVAEVGNVSQATYYAGTRGSPVTQELFTLSDTLEVRRLRDVVLPDVAAAYVEAGAVMLASRGLGGVVSVPLGSGPVKMAWDIPAGTIGVAHAGSLAFAMNDATRAVVVRSPSGRIQQIALGGGGDPELARGRALFHQANNFRISGAPVACASCHVNGRDDGRTWLGQQSKRQTPMLAGRDIAHTGPYGWSGRYEKLEGYIAFTIRERLLGDGLGKNDLAALARYVREGLRPVERPSPSVAQRDGVRRGRLVFHDQAVGCSTCHSAAESFTDGVQHDVWPPSYPSVLLGLLAPQTLDGIVVRQSPLQQLTEFIQQQNVHRLGISDTLYARPTPPPEPPRALPGQRYDTPSLKQLALTAPYLHDGSAKTIDDVLVRLGDHMGTVSRLSARERGDLIAYLSTL